MITAAALCEGLYPRNDRLGAASGTHNGAFHWHCHFLWGYPAPSHIARRDLASGGSCRLRSYDIVINSHALYQTELKSHKAPCSTAARVRPLRQHASSGDAEPEYTRKLWLINVALPMTTGLVLLPGQARRLSESRRLTRNNHPPCCQGNPVATKPSAIETESNRPSGADGRNLTGWRSALCGLTRQTCIGILLALT